ncbi:tRNA (cytidine(56)-2'-O)-methyltransferase [bacterium]|nr:MAG: tRNA (cytidine(56)-2'-O)-methyltransferase [bacterium]
MISVMRLGHRIERDKRLTTHVFLASRALGADEGVYSGERDEGMERSIRKVVSKWGGDYRVKYCRDYRETIREYRERGFYVVHLTMYGIPLQEKIGFIRRKKDVLVVVGGEKVPPEIYGLSHSNVSVTNQPHSEVAALSIFLDRYFKGKELERGFRGAKIRIIPQERGKKTVKI